MKLSVKIYDLKKSPELLWNEIHYDMMYVNIYSVRKKKINSNTTNEILKEIKYCIIETMNYSTNT